MALAVIRAKGKMMPEFTVGNYLATRLQQIGIGHCFMVPGDFNLASLDQLLANPELVQIGCCNELHAAYARKARMTSPTSTRCSST